LICLGSGTANKGGEVHIAESPEIDFLPVVLDDNFPDGAKIWLVLKEDVGCDAQVMIGWNPKEYLFEDDLIQFNEGDQFISDEFTFSGNGETAPDATGNESYFNDEDNILTTDCITATNYYLHISDGPVLEDGLYGLYLADYSGDINDLVIYYDLVPDPWKTYLIAAANGNKPFAYIQVVSGTPLLLDAAEYEETPKIEAMTIPCNYPEGTYTVAGKVETSAGWKAVTFDLTIE